MSETATQKMMRIDMRRLRAERLIAAVMHELWPRIDAISADDVPDRIGNILREAMLDAFFRAGTEVITDYDRKEIGLPPRGPDGWTVEEMMALQRRRLELLTAPISFTLPPHPPHKRQRSE